ncbi:sulfurtransferase TusA family protein [Alkalicoccus chagannorensis]|uniref:sulfurtransferase TusA family protein n=1 Tax=Alkalicoccus chagannorensis TaxID=427072 RepID=UPI0003F8818F|nr:sulfurtransferase TusA family protein [Alkalicoccus chagannorensis]
MTIYVNEKLDAKGLACPMPIVKTKKQMENMQPGEVIEVQATDEGSLADLQAWAGKSGHQYIGTNRENGVLFHYLRKSSGEENTEHSFEPIVDNEALKQKLQEDIQLVDVREEAEYAFSHIPGAVSAPLGELDAKMEELDKDKPVYVVCRTGTRSDLAAQKLSDAAFKEVFNVVPGMSSWDGETEGR